MDILDFIVFGAIILGISFIGLYFSRSEKNTSSDYFLAGKKIRWWGVAGSLFATNISSNQLVGMLGVGFSIGFAQSLYEFGSIPALMVLAYFLLPAYRKLGVTTLSQYLENKFGRMSSISYSIISILLILIQMTAAFYIGGRTTTYLVNGVISYEMIILLMAVLVLAYTYKGGLESVILTDVIQSFFLIGSACLLTYFTFASGRTDSFFSLITNHEKLRLSLPASHPQLPFPGAMTGLFLLHLFYWTSNQYIVQRSLAAISLEEARKGIIVASFLKIIIPFITILTGIAASQMFLSHELLPDDTFSKLLTEVVPSHYGFKGFILAGVFCAIVSSLDSMVNSAATLFSIDLYAKLHPRKNTESQLIHAGQYFTLFILALSVIFAITLYTPDSKGNFFIRVSDQSSYLTPGILAVFLTGILWRTPSKFIAITVILLTPFLSISLEKIYLLEIFNNLRPIFGEKLNFLYRVLLCFSISFTLLAIFPSKILKRQHSKKDTKEYLERLLNYILNRTMIERINIALGFILLLAIFIWGELSSNRFETALPIALFVLVLNRPWKSIEKSLVAVLLSLFVFIMFYYH
ncbi:MAG: sodium/solute symporter [Leptospiraceae bacterium]|nr:sodium/solute symporter [Leptospiraceae bacterium]